MKKLKGSNEPKSVYIQRRTRKMIKNQHSQSNINNNPLDIYGYEAYQSMQTMEIESPFDEKNLGSGELVDQIQSYKEQLIDAKLKNIKLTNEVQKLKELSKTQMTKFYSSINTEENDIQNQTDSMFYKGKNGGNDSEQIKIIEEKYEKKLNKYHNKIKDLKDHNSKLEDLVLKLKDTLDRANEVFPNFLMQISNNNNNENNNDNNNNKQNNINNLDNKKDNPLMVSVGEDPINIYK